MKKLILLLCFIMGQTLVAQVGIGNTNPQSKLDISASNVTAPANTDGILIPRIDNFPASNPTAAQDGMMVFYTGTAHSGKGFYYWDNSITDWVYAIGGADTDWTEVGADIERQSGDVYIGDANTTDNNLYISNRIFDWDDTSYWLKPNGQSALSTLQIDNGTSSNPSLHFLSDNSTGISGGTSYINMVTDGVTRHQFTDKGQLEFFFKQSVLLGRNAGENLSATFNDAVFIGEDAGRETTTGSGNIALGRSALVSNTTGSNNISMGSYSITQNTTGIENIGLGASSLSKLTGSYNVAIGSGAGNIDVNSTNNTYIGRSAGGGTPAQNFSRTGNVFIGTFAGYGQNMSNRLFIENSSATTPLIYGEFDNDVVRVNGEFQVNNPATTGYSLPTTDGTANQVITTDGLGNASWSTLSISSNTLDEAYDEGGTGAGKNITADSGAVRINGTDGFLVTGTIGSGDTIDTEVTGAGTRMFFNPNKAAFRAGYVNGSQWDNTNIGNYSIGLGENSTASGNYSTAIGGSGVTASGDGAIAFGVTTTASGFGTTAFGWNNTAFSGFETVIGTNSTTYTPNSTSGFNFNDRLFVIGNGTNTGARSNALTIYKDGRMNINDAYTMPTSDGTANQIIATDGAGQLSFIDAFDNQTIDQFSLSGTTLQLSLEDDGEAPQTVDLSSLADTSNTLNEAYNEGGAGAGRTITANSGAVTIDGTDGIMVTGTYNSGDAVSVSGVGTRMFFNPQTGAFRAGSVGSGGVFDPTAWNSANLGPRSFAVNIGTIASGSYSFASGLVSEASGLAATAMGENTIATGTGEMAVGSYNSSASSRKFVVGNGNGASRSNAFEVYNNGTVTINDAYSFPTTDGTIDQILRTNGAGNTSWVNPSTVFADTDDQQIDIFNLSGTTLQLSLQDDGMATQTVDLSSLSTSDSDWYVQATTNNSTNINDNIYTQGNVGIGLNTPTTRLHVDGGTTPFRVDVSGTETLLLNNNTLEFKNTNSSTYVGEIVGLNATGSNNTGLGYAALRNVSTGTNNTAIGSGSLDAITTASNNTSIGANALTGNGAGENNVAIGVSSLASNSTGENNVAVGYQALTSNTTQGSNNALGYRALASNTNGFGNSAFGYLALESNTTADRNVAFGNQALRAQIGGGFDNVALGYFSLNNNTTGDDNVAVGSQALMANTASRFNVAVGSDALASITTNGQNVAVGHEALTANTASWNTAMGYRALTANTTGQYNVSMGHSALLTNTVGSGNSAMGYQAAGNFNNNGVTAIGYQSLANGTGAENTSIGYRSMATATTGTENVSIGHQAMELATTASQNVSIGYLSLGGAATTGNRNVSIGRRSMFSNTTGGDNVAVGYATLSDNTTGYDNTAVGGAALIENTTGIANTALGEIALENNTTGSNNVGVGKYSGRLNVSGNDNTYIGTDAGHNSTGSSNVHLGYRAGFNNGNSNRLYIDNSDTASPLIYGTFNTNEVGINWNSATALPNTLSVNGNASKSAAGAWLANSDRRLKKNIETIADEKALEKLLSLRGVTYEWDDNQTGIERPEGIQYGFIAQELMEVFPEKVTKDGLGFYQTAYGDYDAVFVQAIKALNNKINNLENENQRLKEQLKQFQNLEARLSALENTSNPINETVEVKNSKE